MASRVVLQPSFWLSVGDHFGDQRGLNGEPSRDDFITFEIESIVFAFGRLWEMMPTDQTENRIHHMQGKFGLYYITARYDAEADTIYIEDFYADPSFYT